MSTLVEIENAVKSLPSVEEENLLRWLQSRLAARTVTGNGSAAEWVRTARGSVRDVAGKSADELRMEYYAAKEDLGDMHDHLAVIEARATGGKRHTTAEIKKALGS